VPELRGDFRDRVSLRREGEDGSKPGADSPQIVQSPPGLDLFDRRGGVVLVERAGARHEDLVPSVRAVHVM